MLEQVLVSFLLIGSLLNAGTQAAHNTTHRLTIKESQGAGVCSSTAVGPHKLLTATHCVATGLAFKVDGQLVTVAAITNDGADHSIMTLSDMTFEEYAVVNADSLKQGDHVYMWGNPDGLNDQYREGYVTGAIQTPDGPIVTLDLNGYFGDSGAGLFNEKGEVVGVISIVHNSNEEQGGPNMKLMGAFPLRFTPAQVMAESLCGDCK
jgi:V8-like Glu-specific endopeptidase